MVEYVQHFTLDSNEMNLRRLYVVAIRYLVLGSIRVVLCPSYLTMVPDCYFFLFMYPIIRF